MILMPEVSQQLVDKVFAMAAEFQQIALLIRGAPPEFFVSVNNSAEVAAILAAGRCLNGNHEIPPGMEVIRGMCRTCFNAARNGMKTGEVSETQLIALGLLVAEKSKGGRKRTLRESPLRQLLEGRPLTSAQGQDKTPQTKQKLPVTYAEPDQPNTMEPLAKDQEAKK